MRAIGDFFRKRKRRILLKKRQAELQDRLYKLESEASDVSLTPEMVKRFKRASMMTLDEIEQIDQMLRELDQEG